MLVALPTGSWWTACRMWVPPGSVVTDFRTDPDDNRSDNGGNAVAEGEDAGSGDIYKDEDAGGATSYTTSRGYRGGSTTSSRFRWRRSCDDRAHCSEPLQRPARVPAHARHARRGFGGATSCTTSRGYHGGSTTSSRFRWRRSCDDRAHCSGPLQRPVRSRMDAKRNELLPRAMGMSATVLA